MSFHSIFACVWCSLLSETLLRWDLLINVRYKIVRFVAVCHFIPSLHVSGVPYWVKPWFACVWCSLLSETLLRWDLLIYIRYKIVRFVAVCDFIPSLHVSGVPYWVKPWFSCVWCSLLSETSVSLSKEHQTHAKMEWNDIRPQTAQFYNERTSTDPVLVTWQNTVYGPPENGFKKRPKHVGGKC